MPIADRPRAVIFDLDGTIVDNMALHAEAFAAFAGRHGLPALTPADRAKLDGRRNSEIFPVLFDREMPREEWLAYEHEKERAVPGAVAAAGSRWSPACRRCWTAWPTAASPSRWPPRRPS